MKTLLLLCLVLSPALISAIKLVQNNVASCTSCPLRNDPVCADGIDFQNACIAACQGVTGFTRGTCRGAVVFTNSDAGFVASAAAADAHGSHAGSQQLASKGDIVLLELKAMQERGYLLQGKAALAAPSSAKQQPTVVFNKQTQQFVSSSSGAGNTSSARSATAREVSEERPSAPSGSRHMHVSMATGLMYVTAEVPAPPDADSLSFPSSLAAPGGGRGSQHRRALLEGADRYEVRWDAYPHSAAAYMWLRNKNYLPAKYCSAAMIGRRLAITAASCIFNQYSGQFNDMSQMRLYPGLHSKVVNTYGELKVTAYQTFKHFVDNKDQGFNLALLILDKDTLGGWFGIAYNNSPKNYKLSLDGYVTPQKRGEPLESQATLWRSRVTMNNYVLTREEPVIHNLEVHGEKGAAVWTDGDLAVRGVNIIENVKACDTYEDGLQECDEGGNNYMASLRASTWGLFAAARKLEDSGAW